jgi:NTP pyrophosphatase (non-canonical NTP hydrolase)
MQLSPLAKACFDHAKSKGWTDDWRDRGVYMHLEVSELIEAIRGKGDSTPTDEAVDVMYVFCTIMSQYDIDPKEVLTRLEERVSGFLPPS